MRIRPYTEGDAYRWDELVAHSALGTFLHTRRFLSYHGDRFQERSLVCEDARGRMIGVFPAALKPDEADCIVSHPGATYGGVLCAEELAAHDVGDLVIGILEYYRASGLRRVEYRSVPPHLHARYCQADVYALWRYGGRLHRRDLWNVISLPNSRGYTNHHRRNVERARKGALSVGVADSDAEVREFHAVLSACLADRHHVSPVHTAEEMMQLRDRFPRHIALWLARDDGGRVLSGSWVFQFAGKGWHTQYIATTPEGRSTGAGHLVIDAILRAAADSGVPCLSFGASTEDEGRRVNRGLLDFKAGFGAGLVCHDTYRISLA